MNHTAAVITVSDRGYRGEREDLSGPAVSNMLTQHGFEVVVREIVPDEPDMIKEVLLRCADEEKIALILTTGGTGFSPRDITPEVTRSLIERETPGIPEYMRAQSMQITPRGCLSRSVAGIRGCSLIVNLPGSPRGATENLSAVLDPILHGLEMLRSNEEGDCAKTEHAKA